MNEVKETPVLYAGGHDPDGKFCVMEAAAYIAGEKWSAIPSCVSKTIISFMVNWNDSLRPDEERTRLLAPLIPVVLGTAGSEASEMKRSWMAFDWLARECGPAFMDLTDSLKPHAKALRDMGPIYDQATLDAAGHTLEAARKASAAARVAARDAAGAAAWAAAGAAAWAAARVAAGDAAWVAARAAARVAAGDAAWDAAWAAARAAAWAAAGDAAWAAAWVALAPAVLELQQSAVDLVKRMADVERTEFHIQRSLRINGYEFLAEAK